VVSGPSPRRIRVPGLRRLRPARLQRGRVRPALLNGSFCHAVSGLPGSGNPQRPGAGALLLSIPDFEGHVRGVGIALVVVDEVNTAPFCGGIPEHVELALDPGDALGLVE
jgi:hypothetical protein